MKQEFFIACALALLVPSAFGENKVNVTVYYESLCPDSIRFIKNQLEPNYQYFEQFIDIEFVPFGIAKSIPQENGVTFSCQHGPNECAGNKIQSCGLNFAQTQSSKVKFIECKIGQGAEGSDLCAKKAGLPYEQIMECYSGELGTKLQLEAEAKTKIVAAPNAIIPFVPTIVYNDQFDQDKQDRSLFQFREVLCEEIKFVLNQIPSVCSTARV